MIKYPHQAVLAVCKQPQNNQVDITRIDALFTAKAAVIRWPIAINVLMPVLVPVWFLFIH